MAPDFAGVDYPTAQNLFANGLAAMFVGGSWEIANFRDLNPDLNFNHDGRPRRRTGRVSRSSRPSSTAATRSTLRRPTRRPRSKFVNFLATQEFGQHALRHARQHLADPRRRVQRPAAGAQVAELNQSATPYTMLVGFRYETPTGSTLLQERLAGMFSGDISPAQVAQEVTDGIAGYYGPFQD